MIRTSIFRRAAIAAGVSVLALTTPAFAQDADAAAEEEESGDIIVTANRVEQNLQDVPIAVSAVSGDRLLDTGTTSLENIGDLVPSVSFRKGTTSANSAIFLRGVGTITFSVAAEPSVSTVVDGIVLSRSGQSFIDLVDIERIEVLRGPQGTLFGKNASAGLVNIISRGGTDSFEFDANAEYYEGDEYRLRASVSGPLGPNLSGRITGFYGSYDGNIRNIATGNDVNGYEHYGVRGILDYDNGPARIRFIADYFEGDDDCCAEVTGVSRGASLDALLAIPGGNARGENQRTVNHNLVTSTQDQQWSLTLSGDFDVSDTHTLSLVGGYRNWQNLEMREGDFLPRAVIGGEQLHDRGFVETDQYSFEARIASDQTSAFSYQAGAFIWYSNNIQNFTRSNIRCTLSSLAALPGGAIPCNTTTFDAANNTTFPTATSFSEVDSTNYALFTQATYRFSDQFSITGGIRWTKDELSYIHTRAPGVDARTGLPATGAGVSGNPAGGTIAAGGNGTNTSTGDSNNSNVSGRASVQFEPNDDLLFYASYTRGYKGPAFNVFFNHTRPTNAVPIDEETSDSFELGIRSQFADIVTLNATAFQATYDGFQANNFVLLNGAVVTNLTNAGTVRTTGFEIDTTIEPTRGLTFRGSVAYADAKVRRFNPNPATNAPDARNGTRLPLAPEWSYNLSADYETPIGDSLRFYAGTQYAWTDDQFSDLGQSGPIDSYGIWNAQIGISDADDNYRLTFMVRNIGDTSYVLLNTSNGQRLHIPRDADRYFGVGLRVKLR
jgi:iron complex outermembrane recepter protein